MCDMHHISTTRSESVRRIALGAAAACAALSFFAASAANAATVSTPPAGPDPVSLTVPAPYDDLASTVCDGVNAIAASKIQSIDGIVKDVYALAGDSVELVGVAKACQWQAGPADAKEWGFAAAEVHWTKTRVGGTADDLGPETVVQEGRSAVPTTSSTTQALVVADDGARVTFGNYGPVTSPNGLDDVSTATTVFLHVLDPRLQLTKEVCATATGCALDDPAGWVPETTAVTGSDVQWRLTATNIGNVALTDVTVGHDDLTGGTATGNGCAGQLVVAELAVGASASIACVTTGVAGTGPVVNTAELTSGFADPSAGGRLLARFPGGVGSGPADARVQPTPAEVPPTDGGDPGNGGDPGDGSGDGDAGNGGDGPEDGGDGGAPESGGAGAIPTAPATTTGAVRTLTDSTRLASTGSDAGVAALVALGSGVVGGLLLVLRRRIVQR